MAVFTHQDWNDLKQFCHCVSSIECTALCIVCYHIEFNLCIVHLGFIKKKKSSSNTGEFFSWPYPLRNIWDTFSFCCLQIWHEAPNRRTVGRCIPALRVCCCLLLIRVAVTFDPCRHGILCKVPVKESTRERPVIPKLSKLINSYSRTPEITTRQRLRRS